MTARSPPSRPPVLGCLVVGHGQMFQLALPRMAYCQRGSHVSRCSPGTFRTNEPPMCALKRESRLRELRHQPFTLVDRQGIVEHDGTLATLVESFHI
jgi:hypothetical protein